MLWLEDSDKEEESDDDDEEVPPEKIKPTCDCPRSPKQKSEKRRELA